MGAPVGLAASDVGSASAGADGTTRQAPSHAQVVAGTQPKDAFSVLHITSWSIASWGSGMTDHPTSRSDCHFGSRY